MVGQGKFRLDLFYRLKVIPIYVPSLRERKECILPLINSYIGLFAEKNSTKKRLSRATLDALLAYSYPGNVRELMNICERLVVMSETEIIGLQDLPSDISGHIEESQVIGSNWPEGMSLHQVLDSAEKTLLSQAILRYGNQCKMAEALGVNQSTIARKLKKHGLFVA
jgi:transcriptional regulator with PAS, ATPase and Fis domain